jgi:hypothetical protein
MTFETTKDPSDYEDYSIDWTAYLNTSVPADRIIESSWTTSTVPNNTDLEFDYLNNFLLPDGSDFLLPDGVSVLLLPSTYIREAGTITTVWVGGGGKLGTKHFLVNHVKTAGGREWDRTIEVTMAAH